MLPLHSPVDCYDVDDQSKHRGLTSFPPGATATAGARRNQKTPLVTSQPHRLAVHSDPIGKLVTPANDAGLDASTCNAKHRSAGLSSSSSHNSHPYCPDDDCYLSSCTSGGASGHRHGSSGSKYDMEGKLLTKSACDSLLVRFSSIMYATFLVILGCILHVSELRQKSKNSTDHIYTIVVALVGIMWLLFLQTDLQRYKRYASKYIFVESLYRDQSLQRSKIYQSRRRKNTSAANLATVDANHHDTGAVHSSSNGNPSTRSTSSSTASLVNDHLSLNTEVIFKKTAYKMYQQRAAMDRMNSSSRALPANHQPHHRYYHRTKLLAADNSPPLRMPTSSSSSNSSSGSLAALDRSHRRSRDNLIPAYKFLHGKMGANFYLKCGMAAFCFGHVIHEGLRFGQQLYFFGTGNQNCKDSAALIAHLITPLYSFYQLFMMFKYSNVSLL